MLVDFRSPTATSEFQDRSIENAGRHTARETDRVTTLCPTCGRPTDEHNRHVRFTLPDPVRAVPTEDLARRTWGSDVMMQVEGIGAFIRILVPIRLTDGYTVTFGAWLGVHPDDLRRAYEVWTTEKYLDLVFDGVLANGLPPWIDETYRQPLLASVLTMDQIPYADGSDDTFVASLLTEEWAHDVVLPYLPPHKGDE